MSPNVRGEGVFAGGGGTRDWGKRKLKAHRHFSSQEGLVKKKENRRDPPLQWGGFFSREPPV